MQTHTHIEARTENTENTHHDIAITVCKFSKFGKSSSLLRCHFNGLGNRRVGVIAPLQVSLPLHIYIYIYIYTQIYIVYLIAKSISIIGFARHFRFFFFCCVGEPTFWVGLISFSIWFVLMLATKFPIIRFVFFFSRGSNCSCLVRNSAKAIGE